jgi:type VI secretion system protein ImpE
MTSAESAAERSLREGSPSEALQLLQEQVRAHPADAKLRIFLFQLLCVLGDWERALKQLDFAATLDPAALAMAQTYREGILCELLRAEIFAGRKSPMILGNPETWLALLIEALLREGQGEPSEAVQLRQQAFEQAPATSGNIDGQPFAWIADADMRLGPVLEAVINGRYYWIPFARLTRLVLDEPADLRDCVWMPAHLLFANGGESVALIPTRYPGSENAEDGLVALSRKTLWDEPRPGLFCGSGQRILATDNAEYGLMDIRDINFDATPEVGAEPQGA